MSGYDLHEVLLFTLQPKNGKVGAEQHLVIDPERNDVSYGGGGWIKPETGLIAADIKIYIGSEPAQHHALFHKANRPVRQDEISVGNRRAAVSTRNGLEIVKSRTGAVGPI